MNLLYYLVKEHRIIETMDEDALIALLLSMNSDMKRSLHDYFNGKTIYFRQYSKPLAKELDRIYNWPENNDKRRNEVTK